MIWLASFPRSGNTFFRNVLYEVYGIASSTYHQEENYPLEPDYHRFPVVKTHLLPSQLQPADPRIKKVYLVREGRDALVSMAHHRKDIVEPGSDYYVNLLEAILAMDGSFFGGWSENVRQWMAVADVVIRFEDLIADPIREVEKLRAVMDLPQPRLDKLPSFQDLKFGKPHYGAGRKIMDDQQVEEMARKNFRRGKTGSWKDEMPPEMEALFWELHGERMEALGYERSPIGDAWARRSRETRRMERPYRVLIEGNKTEDAHMDGVRRYLEELLFGLYAFQRRQPEKWRIDVLTMGDIIPIADYIRRMEERRNAEREAFGVTPPLREGMDHFLLNVKARIQRFLPAPVYDTLAPLYRALPVRQVLSWMRGDSLKEKYEKAWKEAGRHHQLLHVPLPQNYFYVSRLKLPAVFTVHDLTHRLFPQFHEQENVRLTEKGMRFLAAEASAVIAVSESTRRDILAHYDLDGQKVRVIHEAANADRFGSRSGDKAWESVRQRYKLPQGPYLISLSTLEPRKNLQRVVEAFLSLAGEEAFRNTHLVICGRKGWKHEELVPAGHPAAGRICFTGHVMDDDLPWLYSRALALCYVAHYEGFGLPPLEAMRCGTPVIYGDNSAFPEVIGEAGLPADASDVSAIADRMRQLATDPELRAELSGLAYQRTRRFSWLKTAFQTLGVYEEIISGTPWPPVSPAPSDLDP
jgi:glycosyltransferase involved in cell wall biosynthesis